MKFQKLREAAQNGLLGEVNKAISTYVPVTTSPVPLGAGLLWK
jgi:hypothetical protein